MRFLCESFWFCVFNFIFLSLRFSLVFRVFLLNFCHLRLEIFPLFLCFWEKNFVVPWNNSHQREKKKQKLITKGNKFSIERPKIELSSKLLWKVCCLGILVKELYIMTCPRWGELSCSIFSFYSIIFRWEEENFCNGSQAYE